MNEPTTQEAEKALEANIIGGRKSPMAAHEASTILDALRSLRTQHTEQQAEIERWKAAFQSKQLYPISEMEQKLAAVEAQLEDAELQHTKDQERIEELEEQLTKKWWNKHEHELEDRIAELERVLANLGVVVNAGGSGDPAGGEVE